MDQTLSRRDMLLSLPTGALLGGTLLSSQTGHAQPATGRAQGPLPIAARLFQQSYRDGEYRLPQLPYAYDALEPHIDAQTMELHHSRHHQAYVDGLNRALSSMQNAGDKEASEIEALQRNISFNGGGHVLHTMFWATMAPNAGGEPDGPIAEAIDESFGGFDAFKSYFTKVATGVKGSGWAILAYEPMGGRLMTCSLGDQDLRHIAGTIPLLGVDVWEHAYYLRYQNRRAAYVEAWWNVVNWQAVNEMYAVHHAAHE
jgi:Fe-Mn family superoxide dismutase